MHILNLIAQVPATLPTIGDANRKTILGPFSDAASGWAPGDKVAHLLSQIVGFLTVAGGIWFLIQLIVGAFKWMTSGGDKNNVEAAKEHLTHAIISLAILVAAYVITGLVGVIFGLDILNPQVILPTLKP